uniref:Secreted protein n=1 Tax=Physcomitrium patens TaxID=3218 RepID=A0A2K1IRK1_PHYPA|nr:hypothetical protein PHYPA_026029 [Physcomitrium patens]
MNLPRFVGLIALSVPLDCSLVMHHSPPGSFDTFLGFGTVQLMNAAHRFVFCYSLREQEAVACIQGIFVKHTRFQRKEIKEVATVSRYL